MDSRIKLGSKAKMAFNITSIEPCYIVRYFDKINRLLRKYSGVFKCDLHLLFNSSQNCIPNPTWM